MITTESITANLKSKKVQHTNRRASRLKIGEMQVTEQIDALYMLRTSPVDYLVVPRVIACCIMLPILTIFSVAVGILGGLFVAVHF